jgi:Rrf2 family protein
MALQEIADLESIPIRYLEQIMSRLRRAGLCSSARGPGGGYELRRPPEDISLGEVIHVLEGRVAVVSCLDKDRDVVCTMEDSCITRDFWSTLSKAIQRILESISLKDLIERDWKDVDLQSLMNETGNLPIPE